MLKKNGAPHVLTCKSRVCPGPLADASRKCRGSVAGCRGDKNRFQHLKNCMRNGRGGALFGVLGRGCKNALFFAMSWKCRGMSRGLPCVSRKCRGSVAECRGVSRGTRERNPIRNNHFLFKLALVSQVPCQISIKTSEIIFFHPLDKNNFVRPQTATHGDKPGWATLDGSERRKSCTGWPTREKSKNGKA